MREELSKLVDEILEKRYSMVPKPLFESIYYEKDKINELEGDIVECGVWRGGMSLYLTKLFPDKKVWLVDSFEGFPDLNDMKYKADWDPHKKGTPIRENLLGISVEEVESVFKEFGETATCIKGNVSDTLKPEVCPIEKIALLRVDVDSYSGTLEVLEYLYPKVVKGGMIILDDANLESARTAILHFLEKENIPPIAYSAWELGEQRYDLAGEGCYIFKQ